GYTKIWETKNIPISTSYLLMGGLALGGWWGNTKMKRVFLVVKFVVGWGERGRMFSFGQGALWALAKSGFTQTLVSHSPKTTPKKKKTLPKQAPWLESR
ncbi:hypothetical protein ACTHT5_11415, partial [Neisseria sp. P0022.S002]|uniref:hypothetical protein n=1 Tax=Neisseria sp. P0022.S002 TaxID=3436827 RepID=UPI003F80D66B